MSAHDTVLPLSVPGDVDSSLSTLSSLSRSPYLPLASLSFGDAAMTEVVSLGQRFIDRGLPILILGETGTGKEYLARALHLYSQRRRAALVAVNCASIPESLIESELFGYTKGAFSGALPGGMKGKIQQAHGGTLFLDEMGDMPAAHQTRLLRVISEKEVMPLGAAQAIPVDCQLICATHQNLQDHVAAGTFREDLYYRIAVATLHLPPLRERSDLRALVLRMLSEEWPGIAAEDAISDAAMALLLGYGWPGNLRQLRSAISYACAVARHHCVTPEDLPPGIRRVVPLSATDAAAATSASASTSVNVKVSAEDALPSQPETAVAAPAAEAVMAPVSLPDTLSSERSDVLRALTAQRWNISAAARSLGICRASLYRKLKSLQIPHLRDYSGELAGQRLPQLASVGASAPQANAYRHLHVVR